ncbi:putative membrane protein [Acetobacterium woodii DSM 1030]|uniref:Putative membrane protein n=1 Tax=Acetobacterium woodii (strain ATCC 29683 / DSM 1030 / JCM 2381 / KCTC 1655 / WB1) TaxID=931626 RepID=H6LHH4_ACEWD|nr:putative membrane protein [Acetobacterium woodii DSM 1030]
MTSSEPQEPLSILPKISFLLLFIHHFSVSVYRLICYPCFWFAIFLLCLFSKNKNASDYDCQNLADLITTCNYLFNNQKIIAISDFSKKV